MSEGLPSLRSIDTRYANPMLGLVLIQQSQGIAVSYAHDLPGDNLPGQCMGNRIRQSDTDEHPSKCSV